MFNALIPPELPRLLRALPWLVLFVSLIVTHQLWKHEQRHAKQELQTQFDSLIDVTSRHVEERMRIYGQVLRGVDGLFAHNNRVGRREFHDYVARLRLQESYPGIQNLQFVPIVPALQKAGHITAIRKEGFPGYTVSPDGERDVYCPIIYTEPFTARNKTSFGYDACFDEERRTAKEQARDLDSATITGKTKLLLEPNERPQAGIVMSLPVYKYGIPHGTLAERRANIMGWVTSIFRMNDLMANILDELTAELDIEIYDGDEVSARTLMYDADGHRDGIQPLGPIFRASKRVNIFGHNWTMVIHSLPAFEARLNKRDSQIVALAGIGTSLLLALIAWLYVHGRERVDNLLRQNRHLSGRMFSMQEEERRTLSSELHDEIGQWLTAIHFQVKTISRIAESESPIHTSVQIINESAARMHEMIRRMVKSLRPAVLDARGLTEGLRELEMQWRQAHPGIACELVLEGRLDDLSDDLSITLYRLVQEALNNIAKHSQASRVSVRLRRVQGKIPDADAILLSVEDDGMGFDTSRSFDGVGLIGMRERVIAAGGRFDLHSAPGQGVRINCELPARAPETIETHSR